MKKLLLMLTILFTLYLGLQFLIKYFSPGHEIEYQLEIDNYNVNVKEMFFGQNNNYYFDVTVNNNDFVFQIDDDLKKTEKVIKDFKYFESDQYQCLLPIFNKGQIIIDIMCIKNNVIYYYNEIANHDSVIDGYVQNLEIYDTNNWKDNKENATTENSITFYPNNILDNHYIIVDNYKGIFTINNSNFKKIANVSIFDKDVYKRDISYSMNNVYITADYNASYNFNVFYIINFTNNVIDKVVSNKKISFDSYIQGSLENYFYLYDCENKIQYQVDINKKNIIEVGNSNIGIKFLENGEWIWKDVRDFANEDLKFSSNQVSSENDIYAKIDKIGDDLSGYYYYYKYSNNNYNVYRAPTRNPDKLVYLFSTSELKNTFYLNGYVYFLTNNEIKYFNDNTGVRTVLRNSEFEFNENLKYYIYIEK